MVDQCEASPPRGTNPFNLRHVDGVSQILSLSLKDLPASDVV